MDGLELEVGRSPVHRTFRKIFPILLAIPALIPLIVFIAIPAIRTIYMSLNRMTYGLPDEFVGLNNYREIFKDPVFRTAFWNTIMFSFSVVAGEVGIGLLAAVIMSSGFKMQKLLIALIMVPYAVSEVVAVIIWKYMLEPDLGIVNYILGFPRIDLEVVEFAAPLIATIDVEVILCPEAGRAAHLSILYIR